jgi:hypothetical protein
MPVARIEAEMAWSRFAVALLMVVQCAQPIAAQEVRTIPTAPSCTTCRITFTPTVRLGDLDGPGQVSDQAAIARGPDGRFYLTSNYAPGQVAIFSAEGRYVRSFGGQGNGPGEYQVPTMVVAEQDAVTVFDEQSMRVTRLNTDLSHVYTHDLGLRPGGAVAVGTGEFVVLAMLPRPERAVPLHLYSASERRMLSSFGDFATRDARGRVVGRLREVASGPDGTIWVLSSPGYRLEQWNVRTQTRVLVLERTGMDGSRIWSIVHGADGLLWVLSHVRSAAWRTPTVDERGVVSDAQDDANQDSVVEVIQPATGELIATGRFRGRLLRFLGPGWTYRYIEDAGGNPGYRIYRVALQR